MRRKTMIHRLTVAAVALIALALVATGVAEVLQIRRCRI